MIYEEFKPIAALRPYIDAYWTVHHEGRDASHNLLMPDGCIDLIVNLGGDFSTDTGASVMQSEKTYLVGTMTQAKETITHSGSRLLGVRFKPGAFSFFFKYASLHEVTDQTIEFDKELALPIARIATDSLSQLNGFFIDRLTTPRNQILNIVSHIQQAKGAISIERLAAENGITDRNLERMFREHAGLTPKQFANFTRYQAAFDVIRSNHKKKSLAEIAFECGYYDHAHLTNEFRKYSGMAPSGI